MPPKPDGGRAREVALDVAVVGGREIWDVEGLEKKPERASEDVEVDVGQDGERKPKALKRPDAPTKVQIAEHFPCHAHYRSWCADCRAGRSVGKRHQSQDD